MRWIVHKRCGKEAKKVNNFIFMPKKTSAIRLKKSQIAGKSELITNAVRAAAAREGLGFYIFLFWEDPKAGSAVTSLESMTPRSAVNLCLLGAEHAIQIDLRQASQKGYPEEYSAIMAAYLKTLVEASHAANTALLALNAKRASLPAHREASA